MAQHSKTFRKSPARPFTVLQYAGDVGLRTLCTQAEIFSGPEQNMPLTIGAYWTLRKEVPMPIDQDLIERARMFEERAEQACDPISRQHYKEMAAHYRALSVEHKEIKPEYESAY
jgi:hypothetical protein